MASDKVGLPWASVVETKVEVAIDGGGSSSEVRIEDNVVDEETEVSSVARTTVTRVVLRVLMTELPAPGRVVVGVPPPREGVVVLPPPFLSSSRGGLIVAHWPELIFPPVVSSMHREGAAHQSLMAVVCVSVRESD